MARRFERVPPWALAYRCARKGCGETSEWFLVVEYQDRRGRWKRRRLRRCERCKRAALAVQKRR